jgi:hypothetical protein
MKYPIHKTGLRNFDNREEWMYQSVIDLLKEFPNAKLFVMVDQMHLCKTFQKKWMGIKNWNSLASKLNIREDSPVKDRVMSIIYYYRLNPVSKDDFYNYGLLNPELRKMIYEDSLEKYGIYNICKVKSPFANFYDVFDYVIINREWH